MLRTASPVNQSALYEAALEGLELQKQRLQEQIRMVRSLLGGKNPRMSDASEADSAPRAKKAGRKQRRKRNLSPEASARISEAQRRRWAAFRGEAEA